MSSDAQRARPYLPTSSPSRIFIFTRPTSDQVIAIRDRRTSPAEHPFRRFARRRFAWAHYAVDFRQAHDHAPRPCPPLRVLRIHGPTLTWSISSRSIDGDSRRVQLLDRLAADKFIAGFNIDLARRLVDQDRPPRNARKSPHSGSATLPVHRSPPSVPMRGVIFVPKRKNDLARCSVDHVERPVCCPRHCLGHDTAPSSHRRPRTQVHPPVKVIENFLAVHVLAHTIMS